MSAWRRRFDFTVGSRGEVPGTPPVKRRMYPTKQIALAQCISSWNRSRRSGFGQSAKPALIRPREQGAARLRGAMFGDGGPNGIATLAIRTCGSQAAQIAAAGTDLSRQPLRFDVAVDRRTLSRPHRREALYETGKSDE
jgi:hypothetical protein